MANYNSLYIGKQIDDAVGAVYGFSKELTKKQDVLKGKQLDAVNSGITAEKRQSYDNVLEADATLKGNKTIEGDLTVKGRLKDKDGNDFGVASIPDDVIRRKQININLELHFRTVISILNYIREVSLQ